jgi:hypothetical protein
MFHDKFIFADYLQALAADNDTSGGLSWLS